MCGTGKSTWLRHLFPEALFVDLLQPDVYREMSARPERLRELVLGSPQQATVVVDEVQRVPELLNVVHALTQAAELAELNRTLESRVQTQVGELERLRRLRRFLSPQVADAVVSSEDETILSSHRRKVAMLFADLRGWTSFADAVEPEELMRVLGEFHDAIGRLVKRFDATVGFLEGDGVQIFFNDPIEIPDAALRAVRTGCALREEMAELVPQWSKRGHDLDFGVGIALGYATCGEVGFEGRSDYAAIGVVTNLASRLADEANGGRVLISQRLYAEVESDVDVEPAGEFTLKGFGRPVAAFNVVAVRTP